MALAGSFRLIIPVAASLGKSARQEESSHRRWSDLPSYRQTGPRRCGGRSLFSGSRRRPHPHPDQPHTTRQRPRRTSGGRTTATRDGPWRPRTSWCPPLTARSSMRSRSTVTSPWLWLRRLSNACRRPVDEMPSARRDAGEHECDTRPARRLLNAWPQVCVLPNPPCVPSLRTWRPGQAGVQGIGCDPTVHRPAVGDKLSSFQPAKIVARGCVRFVYIHPVPRNLTHYRNLVNHQLPAWERPAHPLLPSPAAFTFVLDLASENISNMTMRPHIHDRARWLAGAAHADLELNENGIDRR